MIYHIDEQAVDILNKIKMLTNSKIVEEFIRMGKYGYKLK